MVGVYLGRLRTQAAARRAGLEDVEKVGTTLQEESTVAGAGHPMLTRRVAGVVHAADQGPS